MGNLVSIIIPAYKEPFIYQTINSILQNATGEIEILPIIDGYKLEKPLPEDNRIRPFVFDTNRGMREAINKGLRESKGKYIMKCDAHCHFAKGFDEELVKNIKSNWLLIPRRYSLDSINWDRDIKRPFRDYHYFAFPVNTDYGYVLSCVEWSSMTKERLNIPIDDTLTFQGSCWFAEKEYFMKRVGYLDGRTETYSQFAAEPTEIGFKYWLTDGEVKVIKTTWYAHLSKRLHHYNEGLFTRNYKIYKNVKRTYNWITEHWMNNREPDMQKPFFWLIAKFWPVPTWPVNWWEEWRKIYGIL